LKKIFSLISALSAILMATPTLAQSMDYKCLVVAYKEAIRPNARQDGIILPDGREMRFSDGRTYNWRDPRQFEQLLNSTPSLAAMFLIPYVKGFARDAQGKLVVRVPDTNEDPGRIRLDTFFRAIYGNSSSEVSKNLVGIRWEVSNSTVSFNKKFGAADALRKVSAELQALVKRIPRMKEFVTAPLGGTFNWRQIAGTNRMSVHSYGVAMDINTKKTDYWQWDLDAGKPVAFKNRIPPEIAEVFERNNFIWGSKWHHYDTMHFEFRPELTLDKRFCETEYEKIISR
jgi:hypothetical protein